jgi:hypothetical protein
MRGFDHVIVHFAEQLGEVERLVDVLDQRLGKGAVVFAVAIGCAVIFERGEHQLPLGAATLASPLGATALAPCRTRS